MEKITFLGLVLALCSACGGSTASGTETPHPATACIPGQTSVCACAGQGPVGSQTCATDGQSYGVCSCPVIPDAGPSDSGVRPQGRVLVTCGGPESAETLTDTNDFSTRTINVSATGRSVEVRRLHGALGWSSVGIGGHVVGMMGTRYFRDLKVRDRDTGQTLMGPMDLNARTSAQTGDVMFIDAFTVSSGTTRRLAVTTDISVREDWYHDLTFGFYAFRVGVEGEQRVFMGDDLRWADTGETVRSDEVTYDPNCFTAPAENDFMVRPRFADLIADRGALAVSSTIVGNAGGVAMLDVAVVNDGNEEGSMSGLVLDVSTRSNGGIDINFRPLQTRCDIQTVDQRTLGYGTVRDTQVEFSNIDARVPGRATAHFLVRCDLVFPAILAQAMSADFYEIRMGALYNRFSIRNEGPARIQGTLVLDQNRLWSIPGAVTITLRPFGG